jgi:hypothetical protein
MRTSLVLVGVLAVFCSTQPCSAITEEECTRYLVERVQSQTNVNFQIPVKGQPYPAEFVDAICDKHTKILQLFNETIIRQPDCSTTLSAPQALFKVWPQCATRCENAFIVEWAKTIPAFNGVQGSAEHNYATALTAPVCQNDATIKSGFNTAVTQRDCKVFARISASRWEQKCSSRCKDFLKAELTSSNVDVGLLFGDERWTEKGIAKTCALAPEIDASRTKISQGTNPECAEPLAHFLAPASHCVIYNCRTALLESWATMFPSLGKADDLWDLQFSPKQRDVVCTSKAGALDAVKTIVGANKECEFRFFVKERLRIDKLDCGNCVDCLVDITKALSDAAPSDCKDVDAVADRLDKCHPICSGNPEAAHKQHVDDVLDLGKVPDCEAGKLESAAAKYDGVSTGGGDGTGPESNTDGEKKAAFDFGNSAFLIGTIAGVGGFVMGAVLLRRHTLADDVRSLTRTMTRVATRGTKSDDEPIVVYARRPKDSQRNKSLRPLSSKNPMFSPDQL